MLPLDLPQPSEPEIAHSRKLQQRIQQAIAESAHGWISYEQYMQMALYEPGLGYYSSGLQKFGEQGDFVTSAEVSPLFAQTLANPLASLLASTPVACVLEFGAGSGCLAADLLQRLDALQQLPEQYLIVELSAELKQRQYETLRQQVPALLPRVAWLSELPATPINAVVLANEVLDAMPAVRFKYAQGKFYELGVELDPPCADELHNPLGLGLSFRPADTQRLQSLRALPIGELEAESGYCSEFNPHIVPWLQALSSCIAQGAVYLIDYGYVRSEYYAAERSMGTAMGYYRHRAFDAPLWYPGLQDLTAFVDFTALAEAALQAGFDVDGFTSQGNFLINCGVTDLLQLDKSQDEAQRLSLIQQMKTLTLPGEMGERFKVMGLSKGLQQPVPGFGVRDLRYSL